MKEARMLYELILTKSEFHGTKVTSDAGLPKVVRHSRYVVFQMTEVVVSKALFFEILERIMGLAMAAMP